MVMSLMFCCNAIAGVDVNVKFHAIRGFEFTDEVAVFDLLDMSLVHGWLVDPQVRQHSLQFGSLAHCLLICSSVAPADEQ